MTHPLLTIRIVVALLAAFAVAGCAGKQRPGTASTAITPDAPVSGLYRLQKTDLPAQLRTAMQTQGVAPREVERTLQELENADVLLLFDEQEDPIAFRLGSGLEDFPLAARGEGSHFTLRLKASPQAMAAKCKADTDSVECLATFNPLPNAEIKAVLRRCAASGSEPQVPDWYEASVYDETELSALTSGEIATLKKATEGRMPAEQIDSVVRHLYGDPVRLAVCGDKAFMIIPELVSDRSHDWPFLRRQPLGMCSIAGDKADCHMAMPGQGISVRLSCRMGLDTIECRRLEGKPLRFARRRQ